MADNIKRACLRSEKLQRLVAIQTEYLAGDVMLAPVDDDSSGLSLASTPSGSITFGDPDSLNVTVLSGPNTSPPGLLSEECDGPDRIRRVGHAASPAMHRLDSAERALPIPSTQHRLPTPTFLSAPSSPDRALSVSNLGHHNNQQQQPQHQSPGGGSSGGRRRGRRPFPLDSAAACRTDGHREEGKNDGNSSNVPSSPADECNEPARVDAKRQLQLDSLWRQQQELRQLLKKKEEEGEKPQQKQLLSFSGGGGHRRRLHVPSAAEWATARRLDEEQGNNNDSNVRALLGDEYADPILAALRRMDSLCGTISPQPPQQQQQQQGYRSSGGGGGGDDDRGLHHGWLDPSARASPTDGCNEAPRKEEEEGRLDSPSKIALQQKPQKQKQEQQQQQKQQRNNTPAAYLTMRSSLWPTDEYGFPERAEEWSTDAYGSPQRVDHRDRSNPVFWQHMQASKNGSPADAVLPSLPSPLSSPSLPPAARNGLHGVIKKEWYERFYSLEELERMSHRQLARHAWELQSAVGDFLADLHGSGEERKKVEHMEKNKAVEKWLRNGRYWSGRGRGDGGKRR